MGNVAANPGQLLIRNLQRSIETEVDRQPLLGYLLYPEGVCKDPRKGAYEMDDPGRLKQLEERLADLKARMPKHTPRPSMVMELEDLEEEIDAIKARISQEGDDAQGAS